MKRITKKLAVLTVFVSVLFCSTHFTPKYLSFTDNPYNAMSINITKAQIDGVDLAEGDEIGVFDGNVCVGVGVVTTPISTSNILAIGASSMDVSESGQNGFFDGNNLCLYKINYIYTSFFHTCI